MTRVRKVLDPTVKRGTGLRPEDRTMLLERCLAELVTAENSLHWVRRLPSQVFDIQSAQPLVDRVVDVMVLTDNILSTLTPQLKTLRSALKKAQSALKVELARSPDDEP